MKLTYENITTRKWIDLKILNQKKNNDANGKWYLICKGENPKYGSKENEIVLKKNLGPHNKPWIIKWENGWLPYYNSKKTASIKYVNRINKTGRWDETEIKQFLQYYIYYGNKWDHYDIPSRTLTQIKSHAQKFLKKEEKIINFGVSIFLEFINSLKNK